MNRQTDVLPSILSHYTLRILRFCELSLTHFFYQGLSGNFTNEEVNIPVSTLQSAEQGMVDLAILTAYMSYARKHIHPQLSDEAAEELTRGYVEMRRRGNFPGSSKKV